MGIGIPHLKHDLLLPVWHCHPTGMSSRVMNTPDFQMQKNY